jgi:hypothetical protein
MSFGTSLRLFFALAIIIQPFWIIVPAQQQPSSDVHLGEPVRVIGVVHRDISNSSPLGNLKLLQPDNSFKLGSDVKIHFVFVNSADHDLEVTGGLFSLEVRDASGTLAPETEWGCREHFLALVLKA